MYRNFLKICLTSLLALSFTACSDETHSDETHSLEVGKNCDPDTYLRTCNADGILNYCGLHNIVHESNCSESGAVCEVVDVPLNGKSLRYADCFTKANECSTLGDIRKKCTHSEYEFQAVETTAICSASLSTSKKYWAEYKHTRCVMISCKDDNQCLEPLVPDQGENCDEKRADRCDGNILSRCSWNGESGYVVAADCSQREKWEGKPATCVSGTVNGKAYANCLTNDDKCENVGDKIKKCEPGGLDLLSTYVCTELTGGKYYVWNTDEQCTVGCTDGKCNPKLVEDHGDKCDPATRPAKCSGDKNKIYSECVNPYAGTEWEEEYSSEVRVHAVDCTAEGFAGCFTSETGQVMCASPEEEP